MKFYSLTNDAWDGALLEPDYQSAREIGKLRLGEAGLYIRNGLKTYYVPYSGIRRCFRRVMMVPAKLCCGRGDVAVENLIICDESRELATITLPGTRAAKALMEELRVRIPDAEFSCPARDAAEESEAT